MRKLRKVEREIIWLRTILNTAEHSLTRAQAQLNKVEALVIKPRKKKIPRSHNPSILTGYLKRKPE